MKTDGTPLHGSYFDLASAKYPDLKPSEEVKESSAPRHRPRRRRLAPVLIALLGALAGVVWLAIALRPSEQVDMTAMAQASSPAQVAAQAVAQPAVPRLEAQGPEAVQTSVQPPTARRPAPQTQAIEVEEETPAIVTAPASQSSATPPVAPPREVAEPPVAPRREAVPPLAPEPDGAREIRSAGGDQPVARDSPGASPPEVAPAEPPVPPTEAPLVPARKISSPPLDYPEAARLAGEEGVVVVEADLDATGSVKNATVVRGRSPSLDRAAVEALETWSFAPATRGGVPVASTYRIGIKFALSPEVAEAPAGDEAAEPSTRAPSGPIEITGDVRPPRRLSAPPPAYPDAAWAAGVKGDVLVRAVIDETGLVAGVEVLKGQPYGMTEAAVEAIRSWKFAPATRNGEPVAVYRLLSVRFEG